MNNIFMTVKKIYCLPVSKSLNFHACSIHKQQNIVSEYHKSSHGNVLQKVVMCKDEVCRPNVLHLDC